MNTIIKYTIKEFPAEMQPRERMQKLGPSALQDRELLALLLSTGTVKQNALELAESLLAHFGGLKGLSEASLDELCTLSGIGIGKGTRIMSALELGERIRHIPGHEIRQITSSSEAAAFLASSFPYQDREAFMALLLNTKNHIISIEPISLGTLDRSLVHPREVFKMAIKKSAAAVIACHNHPSGDPRPSKDDIAITSRLYAAGELLGIAVLDHIILGDSHQKAYYSFLEENPQALA